MSKLYHLSFKVLIALVCSYSLLACNKKNNFEITVDGKHYPTKMKEAHAYLSDISQTGLGAEPKVILNFPTPRKGDPMGGYGTGLMLRLDANNIESGDEFFLGIYEAEGTTLNQMDAAKIKAAQPSSLDPDTPIDWRANSSESEATTDSIPGGDSWRSRSIEANLEAGAIGASTVNSYSTRDPGGGIHIIFDEFNAKAGGNIKGKIVEATLIGRTINVQTYEQASSEIKIMKIRNLSFDTTFQSHHPIMGK